MRNTFLTGVAMGALWIGIILLVVGLWLDIFILALIGMLMGGLFGLPAVYLLLDKDRLARQQERKFLFGRRKRPQQVAHSDAVIEGKLSESITMSPDQPEVIQIPVKVNAQVEPEKFEQVVAQKPVTSAEPAAVRVPVDILVEEDAAEDVVLVASEPVPPPKPSEWELQKQADAEYKQIKEEIEALAPTAYDKLIDYLGHNDARVRLAVVQRLRHLEDERVVSNLQQALDDEDAVVQRAARIALEEAEDRTMTDEK